MIARAKTPENRISQEKYFLSKNKLISQTKEQNHNNINEQNNLDNYDEEKYIEISNKFDDSIKEITLKQLHVSPFF